MLTSHLLAATADDSSGAGLITIYYVIAILGGIVVLGGVPVAAIKLYGRARDRFRADGAHQAELNTTIRQNTAANEANTKANGETAAAVRELGGKFDAFADSMREELGQVHGRINGLRDRITRVEERQQSGQHRATDGS